MPSEFRTPIGVDPTWRLRTHFLRATRRLSSLSFLVWSVAAPFTTAESADGRIDGTICDADTGKPIAARVYLERDDGTRFHVQSAEKEGSAIPYRIARSPVSVEVHTSVSAHPFTATLPAGRYTLTVERGKAYRPARKVVDVRDEPVQVEIRLSRWIDMGQLGWYSGETHVHRSVAELPTLMLAEDLNVALPLTYWVTRSDTPPSRGDKNTDEQAATARLIEVDTRHVIYPLNTEYEIFRVHDKPHTLGAVFALNHKTVLRHPTPPVCPIARQVHAEGGLLELDKHNWPWSMMLVPVMDVDLYELSNNHIWRTEFHFRDFGEAPPAYMGIEMDDDGLTERGWIDFTFQNYYLLLNCGFRLRPTAGTASGVHPVPLGYGRVYVHLPDGFSYDGWMKGLDAGRSFVTTGPMMDVRLNDAWPGTVFRGAGSYRLNGWVAGERPLSRIEVVSAGNVIRSIEPSNKETERGRYESPIDEVLEIPTSTWLIVRAYQEGPDARIRFAHSAAFHVEVPDKPLRPSRQEVNYLIERVEREIERNTGVLSDEALEEYQDALQIYKRIAESAK